MDESIIKIIIAGIIAASPGIYAVIRGVKKDRVDNATAISNAALELLKPYKDELAEIRQEIRELKAERDALKDWAEKLCCQVRGAGLVPEKYIEPKTEPRR